MSRIAHILPDCLAPNLAVWFVGTAAGPRSAATRTYYAHPGNRFWRTLHAARITPRLYSAPEYRALIQHRIGLTDVCKVSWGIDSNIPNAHFDVEGFRKKVTRFKPCSLAFTSKRAASLWLGRTTSHIDYGQQDSDDPSKPLVFVLPSPSGLATSYWSIEPWRELGCWLREAGATPLRQRSDRRAARAK